MTRPAKLFLLSSLLVAVTALVTASSKEQQAKELSQRAAQVSFSTTDNLPFHEMVKFIIHSTSRPDVSGEYTIDFLDEKHHREHATSGDYSETWLVDGEHAWHSGPTGTKPFGLVLIRAYAPPFTPSDVDRKVSRLFSSDSGGLTCVERKEAAEIDCYDSSGFLVATSRPRLKVIYSDFKSFGSKQVPGHYELQTIEGMDANAEVRFREGDDLKPESFQASAQGLEPVSEDCANPQPPQVTYSPSPLPMGDKSGTVVLWIRVDERGIPRDPKVIRSLDRDDDHEAIRAVEGWRFKPATCEGKPIPVQISVEVSFNVLGR